MEIKYRVLRFIAGLYKVLAWVLLVGGILGAIGAMVGGVMGGALAGQMAETTGLGIGGLVAGIAVGITLLIVAVLLFVFLYAAGEVVTLVLALEQNTREAAYYMRGDSGMARPYGG